MDSKELADRCGVSIGFFNGMETKNRCKSVLVLTALQGMAKLYLLPEVDQWLEARIGEIQFAQRPTKFRDGGVI